ncbi:hypothetical protein D3C86_1278850 [compost metagenome]
MQDSILASTGSNHIDANPVRRQRLGHGAAHADQAAVGPQARVGLGNRARRWVDVDDAAATFGLDHVQAGAMDDVVFQCNVFTLGAVVDQHIDAAEALFNRRQRRLDTGTTGAVEADGQHFAAFPAQVRRQLFQLRSVLCANGHTGSGEADQPGEMCAQAGSGIGHEHGFAGHGKRLHEVAHQRASIGTARRRVLSVMFMG